MRFWSCASKGPYLRSSQVCYLIFIRFFFLFYVWQRGSRRALFHRVSHRVDVPLCGSGFRLNATSKVPPPKIASLHVNFCCFYSLSSGSSSTLEHFRRRGKDRRLAGKAIEDGKSVEEVLSSTEYLGKTSVLKYEMY